MPDACSSLPHLSNSLRASVSAGSIQDTPQDYSVFPLHLHRLQLPNIRCLIPIAISAKANPSSVAPKQIIHTIFIEDTHIYKHHPSRRPHLATNPPYCVIPASGNKTSSTVKTLPSGASTTRFELPSPSASLWPWACACAATTAAAKTPTEIFPANPV